MVTDGAYEIEWKPSIAMVKTQTNSKIYVMIDACCITICALSKSLKHKVKHAFIHTAPIFVQDGLGVHITGLTLQSYKSITIRYQ